MAELDLRIYGGGDVTPRPKDVQIGTQEPYQAPTPVSQAEAFKGSPLLAEGEAFLRENNRERAGVLESAGAAMSQWGTTRLLQFATAPKHEPKLGFNYQDEIGKIPFPIDQTERDYLRSMSPEEYAYKYQQIVDKRTAEQAMGDSPWVSFLAMAIDPVYMLGVDVGAIKAASLLRQSRWLSRGASGAIAGVGAYALGKVEQQVAPVSDKEVLLNALGNGAISTMFPGVDGLEKVNKRFPDRTLRTVVDDIQGGKPLSEVDPEFVGPVQVADPTIPRGEGNAPVSYAAGRNPSEANPVVDDYKPLPGVDDATGQQLIRDGRVHQVDSVDDIAKQVRSVELGRTVIDPDAKAVYLPAEDRIFLIRNNIKPEDDVRGIVLHEYGVHMNAERVLGTKVLGEVLDSLDDMARKGNARAKQAYADVPANTEKHLVREEALGYYIERNHGDFKDSIVSRFVGATREMLRKSGLASMKYSEADIVYLVRKAAKGGEKAKKTSFDVTFPYAWHGSPTKGIDKLDTIHIGTGEGNAAFGWGHYLTSEKGTGLDYRNKEAARRGMNPNEGGLYRVKINAKEEEFLDLDARVQSPQVETALHRLGVRTGLTGKAQYEYLARKLGSAKAASEALYAAGVKGNRYATGKTRHTGDRSSNFVVFHNDAVDIAARYSKGATPAPTRAAAQAQVKKALNKSAAEWLSISLHKKLGSFSGKAKEISDTLVSDPLEMNKNSVVDIHRAVRADLEGLQHQYGDLLTDELAKQGFGVRNRIFKPRQAAEAQRKIETAVASEMLRRNRLAQDGLPIDHAGVPAHIKAMADALDAVYARALAELKAAGVEGADQIKEMPGYYSRRWDSAKMEAIHRELVDSGMTPEDAKLKMVDTISIGIQRANGWDAKVSQTIAKAIYDRAWRKGHFEDSAFHFPQGLDVAKEVRDILEGSGASPKDIQQALDVLVGKADEKGKAPQLKRRIDLTMDESFLMPDGTSRSIGDMIDTNLVARTEQYLDSVAAQVAFARKGLTKASDIDKMRTELLDSIPDRAQREEAAQLFDDTIAYLRGFPTGDKVPRMMRLMQAVTQMVSLAMSGPLQVTDYAKAMGVYGAGATLSSALKELPVLRGILNSPREAGDLRNILARNASQDIRIRPFVQRLEDNFEIPVGDAAQLSLMQAKQLVPHLNALKYIQHHQARTVANLIVDVFDKAVKGNQDALRTLESYGLESGNMGRIRADVAAHGTDTSKWSDETWAVVRTPLTKMMDESVLRNKTGEIPAFAQFSLAGKFIFTYRGFVLGAHNKIMAGTLGRSGFTGLGLLALYQFPLAVLANSTGNALSGKDGHGMASSAISQMGALGLFAELWGAVSGDKQQFGSPGLIFIDRMYKLTGDTAKLFTGDGSVGKVGADILGLIPLLSVILPVRAIGEYLKD